VILAPAAVQGEEAPGQLIQALASLNQLKPPPDVILLARGGGSIEDLWAFNAENLVRAVATSQAPVICGIGHETDFTLCDFAADLRAPTPTAAAELATPTTLLDLRARLANLASRLSAQAQKQLATCQAALASLGERLRFYSPLRRLQSERQRLDDLAHRLHTAMAHHLLLESNQLEGLSQRLEALSPLQVLARGYAVVTRREDGALITRVAQARDGIRVRVADGTFEAEVSSQQS